MNQTENLRQSYNNTNTLNFCTSPRLTAPSEFLFSNKLILKFGGLVTECKFKREAFFRTFKETLFSNALFQRSFFQKRSISFSYVLIKVVSKKLINHIFLNVFQTAKLKTVNYFRKKILHSCLTGF